MTRGWLASGALWLALFVPCGCAEDVDTPAARIQLFTRCHVPSGSIQAQDRIEGSEHAETWARVLLPRDKVDAYVQSCGYPGPLDESFHSDAFRATPQPWWWDAQSDVLSKGGTFTDGTFFSELLVVLRDTDVAVYVHTRSQ